MVPTLGTELGAPVISIQTAEGSIVTMPGYENYVSENNNGGFNDLIGDFFNSMDSQNNPGQDFLIIPEELESSEVGVDIPVVETEPEATEETP